MSLEGLNAMLTERAQDHADALQVLEEATRAAVIAGVSEDAIWATVAESLVAPVARRNHFTAIEVIQSRRSVTTAPGEEEFDRCAIEAYEANRWPEKCLPTNPHLLPRPKLTSI